MKSGSLLQSGCGARACRSQGEGVPHEALKRNLSDFHGVSRECKNILRESEIWLGPRKSEKKAAKTPRRAEEDLRSTGGSRPPLLRLHSDKASEFLSPMISPYLCQQGVCHSQQCGRKMGWHCQGSSYCLLADVRLPPVYWSYACGWVAHAIPAQECPGFPFCFVSMSLAAT